MLLGAFRAVPLPRLSGVRWRASARLWTAAGGGVSFQDVQPGSGPQATIGDTVQVQYSALAASTGKLLECTYQSGVPLDFKVGSGRVMPGIDVGVVGMQLGGIRTLVVPTHMGYGRLSTPSNADLLVEVELVHLDTT